MAITPLDLQTMFVRLNEVGKEQNQLKEAVAAQQAAGARELRDQEIRQDNSVNRTEEDQEAGKVKDEGEKEQQEKNASREKEQEKENPSRKKQVFSDPEIGSHIDISG